VISIDRIAPIAASSGLGCDPDGTTIPLGRFALNFALEALA
jgi:hypothetical protein